jgi:hypothetical protein
MRRSKNRNEKGIRLIEQWARETETNDANDILSYTGELISTKAKPKARYACTPPSIEFVVC